MTLLACGVLSSPGCSSFMAPAPVAYPGTTPMVAPAAAPCNLWSFLLPTPQQRQSLCNCICGSPLGQMANSMLKPMSLFSGGLVPGICPGPDKANPADLAKPADSAAGAAARIKQSEADAKARCAAVRYLATVDCKRFPEAEAALITSLLADSSECVRWEAARALGSGCCCTQQTIEALMQSVSGEAVNNPPEKSDRVRCTAATALENCLARCPDGLCEPPVRPESPAPPELPAGTSAPAEAIPTPPASQPNGPPSKSLLEQARRVLDEFHARHLTRPQPVGPAPADTVIVTAQVPAGHSHRASDRPAGMPPGPAPLPDRAPLPSDLLPPPGPSAPAGIAR